MGLTSGTLASNLAALPVETDATAPGAGDGSTLTAAEWNILTNWAKAANTAGLTSADIAGLAATVDVTSAISAAIAPLASDSELAAAIAPLALQADVAAALAANATADRARAGHTGTQPASSISDFAAAVGALGYATAGDVSVASTADRARSNHTGTQLAATVSDFDAVAGALITSAISPLAVAATVAADLAANATADRARANHTGSQLAATISDFNAAVGVLIAAASIPVAQITGTLPATKGGTGLAALGPGSYTLAMNGAGTALEYVEQPIFAARYDLSNIQDVAVGNDLLPNTTNTRRLGSTSKGWQELHITRTARIGGSGTVAEIPLALNAPSGQTGAIQTWALAATVVASVTAAGRILAKNGYAAATPGFAFQGNTGTGMSGLGGQIWFHANGGYSLCVNSDSGYIVMHPSYNFGWTATEGNAPDAMFHRYAAAAISMGKRLNAPVTQTFKGPDAIAANSAGGVLNIGGGAGWGTGAAGDVNIQTSTPVGAGSTVQTLTTRATFDAGLVADAMGMLLWDYTRGTVTRVKRGAADSGGTGFRSLIIDN